jgi:hypothetical protein
MSRNALERTEVKESIFNDTFFIMLSCAVKLDTAYNRSRSYKLLSYTLSIMRLNEFMISVKFIYWVDRQPRFIIAGHFAGYTVLK